MNRVQELQHPQEISGSSKLLCGLAANLWKPAEPRDSEGQFRTEDLPFAAYLHSTRQLRFMGCESDAGGRIKFVFDDPDGKGRQLEIQFEAGAECPGVALYESIKRLRKIMTRAQEQHGVSEYEFDYRR